MSRMGEVFLDTKGLTLEQLESFGRDLAYYQRAVNWMIGDVARYAKYGLKLGENYTQVFPEWMSPGLIQRCEAVALAYPREEDRNVLATWTIHMRHASEPDRIERVAASVEKGLTSDEDRQAKQNDDDEPYAWTSKRWLLAIDVNYFLHRFWYSGAGVESAMSLASWVQRTVERLKQKGLTDVACCFDSPTNHRKELTKDWDDKYKGNRGPKDHDLLHQIRMVRELLEGHGFCCVSVEGYESDDCIASLAAQFPAKVTILSQDKDLKQCLSERVIMLLDVTWDRDEASGDMLPTYHWYTAAPHERLECRNLLDDTGLTPQQFPDLQCLMGDATDCIKGAPGIGETGALNLMREFGSVAACIQAAHDNDARLLDMKRGKVMAKGLLELEGRLDTMRRLVTLVDTLPISSATRI